MKYIKACCTGMCNPVFYFSFSDINKSVEEAKDKIDGYLNEFESISIGCSREKMVLLDDTDDDYETAVKCSIDLDRE